MCIQAEPPCSPVIAGWSWTRTGSPGERARKPTPRCDLGFVSARFGTRHRIGCGASPNFSNIAAQADVTGTTLNIHISAFVVPGGKKQLLKWEILMLPAGDRIQNLNSKFNASSLSATSRLAHTVPRNLPRLNVRSTFRWGIRWMEG